MVLSYAVDSLSRNQNHFVAANGPKAQTVTGEIGDGWITTTQPPDAFAAGYDTIAQSAKRAGRDGSKPYTVVLGMGCVLQPGESRSSQRVVDRLGWAVMPGFHAAWEAEHGPGSNVGLRVPQMADAYKSYIDGLHRRDRLPRGTVATSTSTRATSPTSSPARSSSSTSRPSPAPSPARPTRSSSGSGAWRRQASTISRSKPCKAARAS